MLYFKFNEKIENPEFINYEPTFKERILVALFSPLKLLLWLDEKLTPPKDCFPTDVFSVDTWYIEYDEQEYNIAVREIGLDKDGRYAIMAPFKDSNFFWWDEDCDFAFYKNTFDIQMITKEEFEHVWNSYSEDNVTHSRKCKKKR